MSALGTLGTALTTTLPAMQWNSACSVGQLALFNAGVKQINQFDTNQAVHPVPEISQGGLYIPSRGHLKLFEGDWIGYDPVTGEVILISAATAASSGTWVHTPGTP